MYQKGISLVEIVLVLALAGIFISSAFTWSINLKNAVRNDTARMVELQEAQDILSTYTSYEDAITATTTDVLTVTDLDRSVRKISVTIPGQRGTITQIEKIFSQTGVSHRDPWCKKITNDSLNLNIADILPIADSFFTDIAPLGKYIVVTADSSIGANPDLYILETEPYLDVVSMLNTGPGLSAVITKGSKIYVANTSTLSQLQVIDLIDPFNPQLIGSYKASLPTPTSTPPKATAIALAEEKIFLGTEKWSGEELQVLDVQNPQEPTKLYGLELGSMVQDVLIDDETVFLALSSIPQFAMYQGTEKIWEFSPSGSAVQEGKRLSILPTFLTLGRTTGGFNVTSNHEVFLINRDNLTTATSTDTAAGVYGIHLSGNKVLSAFGGSSPRLEISNPQTTFQPLSKVMLPEQPKNILCSGDDLYVVTQSSIIKL